MKYLEKQRSLARQGPPGRIQRNQYYDRDYRTRHISFDAIKAIDISRNGKKVQLADKTIKDLVMVRLPDPDDKTYFSEGRPQRKKLMNVNLANNKLGISQKLDVINQALAQGLMASESQQETMRFQLVDILDKMKQVESAAQARTIISAVSALGMSQNYQSFTGSQERILTPRQFSEMKGEVIAYAIANANRLNRGMNAIFVISRNGNDTPVNLNASIDGLEQIVKNQNLYLDLLSNTFVPRDVAESMDAVDENLIDDVDPEDTIDMSAIPAAEEDNDSGILDDLETEEEEEREEEREEEENVEDISGLDILEMMDGGIPESWKNDRERLHSANGILMVYRGQLNDEKHDYFTARDQVEKGWNKINKNSDGEAWALKKEYDRVINAMRSIKRQLEKL